MPIRVVRLGSPRSPAEGPRLGTVRRPPRGVRRTDYASRDYYDAWLPELAPSAQLLGWFRHKQPVPDADWDVFARRYRAEMTAPEAQHLMDALAALSTDSRHEVVPGSSHQSLTDDPAHAAVVSGAIVEVVQAVRTGMQLGSD